MQLEYRVYCEMCYYQVSYYYVVDVIYLMLNDLLELLTGRSYVSYWDLIKEGLSAVTDAKFLSTTAGIGLPLIDGEEGHSEHRQLPALLLFQGAKVYWDLSSSHPQVITAITQYYTMCTRKEREGKVHVPTKPQACGFEGFNDGGVRR